MSQEAQRVNDSPVARELSSLQVLRSSIGPVVRQENLSHHRLGLQMITGSLLAPPRDFGGVLAGAAGTVKKAKEGTAFSRALIREEEVEAGHSDPGVRYAPAPAVQAFRRME